MWPQMIVWPNNPCLESLLAQQAALSAWIRSLQAGPWQLSFSPFLELQAAEERTAGALLQPGLEYTYLFHITPLHDALGQTPMEHWLFHSILTGLAACRDILNETGKFPDDSVPT
ncbi:hypothetical protein JZ751_022181, partial [Albula glossodonta]